MKIFKKVREFAGLNLSQMQRKLQIKRLPDYTYIERKSKSITSARLAQLRDIYMEAGGTLGQFYSLLNGTLKMERALSQRLLNQGENK